MISCRYLLSVCVCARARVCACVRVYRALITCAKYDLMQEVAFVCVGGWVRVRAGWVMGELVQARLVQ